MKCSCGYPSREKCHALFHEILAKEFSDFRYAKVHRLTVDVYSLQHPQQYMKSAKSYAAHLTGICVAMEYDGSPELLRKLQTWLNGKKEPQRPGIPEKLGRLTIAHISEAETPEEHERLIKEWAQDVWDAWSDYHDLARHWIEIERGKS